MGPVEPLLHARPDFCTCSGLGGDGRRAARGSRAANRAVDRVGVVGEGHGDGDSAAEPELDHAHLHKALDELEVRGHLLHRRGKLRYCAPVA